MVKSFLCLLRSLRAGFAVAIGHRGDEFGRHGLLRHDQPAALR
jgi:hypothetical protein